MTIFKNLRSNFFHAIKNLLPIVGVVVGFQWLVFQEFPENSSAMALGIFFVALGIAFFLQGLELSIFPVGKSLSHQFARRGSIVLLMGFGFSIGFSAVIAEPALIAVVLQAEEISSGRIDGFVLRLLIALSVGLVVALGVLRIILGHPVHVYLISGYVLVVVITFFAPPEIVGLAYDSGGVTTNIVTVPLIAALGIGLAASIRGRSALIDGFGLVALAVMVPMISVQAYGIWVYAQDAPDQSLQQAQQMISRQDAAIVVFIKDLLLLVRDVLPIMFTILFFQYIVLKQSLRNPLQALLGFILVMLGLYVFVLGLKMGLFPIGAKMAEQLILLDKLPYLYLFAFSIGFATTMAEPALLAIGQQAEEASAGLVKGQVIRLLVAIGVAVGITVGVYRLIHGGSLHHTIIVCYLLVIILTLMTPKYIIALAYDLGGVTTSEVTVPLITALGIGLATHIEGRNVLIDGFGLIAFASIFPIISVMGYALFVQCVAKIQRRKT